ncbi:AraC family transcriptional regulator [Paenibacillus sp. N4]|uniref:helix-turn-helix domain-containing protein n=1 Tax=Paenibacillus vietnamensis TaxID=2590547 RepID=UPI001CD04DF2|nr:helix-turn-helix domain-containing protein [Paenibacillus vietnamensis]MCA0757353.1 AraC family transcriptional regulator [Paenibacillus vietnamensis]
MLKSRKYLQRIILYFNLSVVGLLVIFSFSYYAYSKNIVLQTQKDANEKVLSQINYNINYLHEIVQNIAIMMSFDKSVIYLMNAKEPDPFTKFQTLRMLDTVSDSTSFVDSIAVYSGAAKQMYVGGSGTWSRTHLKELEEMTLRVLREPGGSTGGRLIPMKTDEGSANVDLFSFFVLESHSANGEAPNAVVVNIRPRWVFENIYNLNSLGGRRDGIVLLDRDGKALAYPSEAALTFADAVQGSAARSGEDSEKFTVRRINGEKYLVSEMSVGVNEWSIMSLLPYDQVMGRVESFRNISFILVGLALLVSIALSAAVANRLYRPIGKLTEQFNRNTLVPLTGAPKSQDELSYISGVYELTLDKLRLARQEENRNQQIVNDYYLRRWMTDSGSLTEEELGECRSAFPRLFPEEDGAGPVWAVAVLALDAPPQAFRSSAQDQLFRFAVCNITEEMLARSYPVRVLDMKNDFLIAIVRISAAERDSDALRTLLGETVDTCRQYYRRTFSAAVSAPVSDCREVSAAYRTAVQQLMYRLLYGPGSVIAPEDVAGNIARQDAVVPIEWEKKLGEAIRARDVKAIRAVLDKWFSAIAAFPFDDMTFAVQQIVLVIRQVLREPVFSAHYNSIAMQTLGTSVIRSDTLAEMQEKLARFLEQVCQAEREEQKEDRSQIVVDAIKEFVDKNALDINLSLQSVATYFKMSSAYVGRIFKQYENVSVGDYINGYRLEKSRDMLLASSYSVKEIADYLGFSNSSYFITLFKKKYGMTPKEFRMNVALGEERRLDQSL